MKIAAVILAAGSSSRMGNPKQLLPYKNTTLLNHTLLPVAALFPATTCVVLGANASVIRATIPDKTCDIIINDEWATGLATSIVAGLEYAERNIPDLEAVLFLTGDQPSVTASHLVTITEQYVSGGALIVASSYDNVTGVPALFHKKFFSELKKLKADAGARSVIRQFEKDVLAVPLADGGIDIDTPAQYEQLINKQ